MSESKEQDLLMQAILEEPRPEWAIGETGGALCLGAHLATKDGRRIGNAHIIGYRPKEGGGHYWQVITDAGALFVFPTEEIERLFHTTQWYSNVSLTKQKFMRKDYGKI